MDSPKKPARSRKTILTLTVLAAIATVATVMIAAQKRTALHPMPPAETQTAMAVMPEAPAAAAVATTPVTKSATKTAPAAKAPAAAKAKAASVPSAPATIDSYEGPSTKTVVDAPTKAPVQDSAAKVTIPPSGSSTVTIAGCLERDGDTFRLSDTSGNAAPKKRSWKSGFLKKGASRIEVLDAANRLKLGDHVGQRVSVTGMLDDSEMQARSLQRVATTCE